MNWRDVVLFGGLLGMLLCVSWTLVQLDAHVRAHCPVSGAE